MCEKYGLEILKNLYFFICNNGDEMKANKAIASVADVLDDLYSRYSKGYRQTQKGR